MMTQSFELEPVSFKRPSNILLVFKDKEDDREHVWIKYCEYSSTAKGHCDVEHCART